MSSNSLSLRQQNEILRRKIEEFQRQRLSVENVDNQIKKFIEESQKNVIEMTDKISQQNASMNRKLHDLTAKYQATLKNQIQLLTKNKELNQKKEKQDEMFNERVEKMTAEYESKIKDFEAKVKGNVKKIKQISEANVIKKLLKSDKFKNELKNRGVKIQVLQKQCQLQQIIAAVQEKETEIAQLQAKSQGLDDELTKMRELIQTMKQLLQNMVKQKENIVKQNKILKQKLKQSEELIGKLLGGPGAVQQAQYEEDFEEEEDEQQQQKDQQGKEGQSEQKAPKEAS